MKKKIKDLTLEQVCTWNCTKLKNCLTCPFYSETKSCGGKCLSAVIADIIVNYQECLEKEVEVDE